MAPAPRPPVTVAIVNDHPVVVRGVHALLADAAEAIEVIELDSSVPVSQPVDVVLYDAFTMEGVESGRVDALLRSPHVGSVVVYTWNVQPDVVEEARSLGIRAIVSKTLSAPDLVAAIQRADAGEFVVLPEPQPVDVVESLEFSAGNWPGRAEGLTAREAEVIALITLGLSNQEIADRIHLSINSVKTYIRTAYRTMGVTSRSQAAVWGLDHGLRPRPNRVVLDPPGGQ